MRILITGCSGYLGFKVVERLAMRRDVEIAGIDVREPTNRSVFDRFARASVTDELAMKGLFDRTRPDVAVHMAFVVTSTHDRRLEEAVALAGTRLFLEGCERNAVPKAIVLSSVAAYGAHDDNDVPLTEKSPIRGVEGYGYSRLKARADLMAQQYMEAHPECELAILRPCLFAGPLTNNNFFDVLKYPIVPQVKDRKGIRDPEFQFIHEDDMAGCLLAAIDKPARGPFNVAAEGTARFSELVRIFGKRAMALPAWMLYPATALLWKLHLVTSPPAQLDFIRYPWIMDASRMRRELSVPRKTTLEAFEEFAAANR